MVECPQCGLPRFKRVHARWYERALRPLIGLVPYRCQQCGWRGWQRHAELQSVFARRTAALSLGVAVAIALTPFVLTHRAASMIESSGRDVFLPEASTTSLQLVSSRSYLSPSGDLWYIVGQVENIGVNPLINVKVVSTWLDKAGAIVESTEEFVDFKRLLPGEVSAFMTITRVRPEMSTFRLNFESQMGESLPANAQ